VDTRTFDAIKRANKLGAKGIEVVGCIEPQLATQAPVLILIIKLPELTNANMAWYE